jgi:hypothetical protein
MKQLRLAALVFASVLGIAVRAQDDEERQRPPIEIPDFSNLDEYIYIPQSSVQLGFRHLSGAKTSFSGTGKVLAPEDPGPATGPNLTRNYHDGSVKPDARVAARLDSSGNPVIDPETGNQVFDPIAPDGKTNTWNYADDRQLTGNGYIVFHTYSADVVDGTTSKQKSRSTNDLDLTVVHDMGKLFGSRVEWKLMGGMSITDLAAKREGAVQANINTLTDYYSLFGATPPAAPYSAPSSTTQTVLDPSGNPVTNDNGTTQTITTDTTVLIGNQPAGRTNTTTADTTSVVNHWRVKGAYYTFRVGPSIWVPLFSNRLHLTVSFGPALIYSGSNYTVTQTFTPDIGAEISQTDTNSAYKLLPGYYADATVQYDLTDRTGFYAGAVFQSAGSYAQTLNTDTAHYSTKIDLSNQNGVRAGMAIRF